MLGEDYRVSQVSRAFPAIGPISLYLVLQCRDKALKRVIAWADCQPFPSRFIGFLISFQSIVTLCKLRTGFEKARIQSGCFMEWHDSKLVLAFSEVTHSKTSP